jgi:hypothetical protein
MEQRAPCLRLALLLKSSLTPDTQEKSFLMLPELLLNEKQHLQKGEDPLGR